MFNILVCYRIWQCCITNTYFWDSTYFLFYAISLYTICQINRTRQLIRDVKHTVIRELSTITAMKGGVKYSMIIKKIMGPLECANNCCAPLKHMDIFAHLLSIVHCFCYSPVNLHEFCSALSS